jgi:Asp-tRNA(Asn)/Glu-tRNA(Gln) amidotransferase C subunit
MFDILPSQIEQVATQTKMLATPEEMEMFTPEEQRLLYFSALSEWLYLMRLNDTDMARLVNKARRDMIKSAEEREKELARIRAGR